MKIKINLFEKNSINNAINLLDKYKSKLQEIEKTFVLESLNWILERANQYLDERDTFTQVKNTTNIRTSWVIIPIGQNRYQLRNIDERAVYAEFGTGVIGEETPHPLADEVDYYYNLNGYETRGWNFYNKEANVYFKNFFGYEGKSFLYDACFDYFEKGEYKRIYQSILQRKLV